MLDDDLVSIGGERTEPEVSCTVITSVDDLSFADFHPIWTLWRERHDGNSLPGRSAFLIEEFLPWVRNIGMMQPVGDPMRLKIRLTSATMMDLNRRNVTDCFIDEISPAETIDQIMAPYMAAAAERRAVTQSLVLDIGFHRSWLEVMVMPLAENGTDVDYFAIALFLSNRKPSPYEPGLLTRYLTRNSREDGER